MGHLGKHIIDPETGLCEICDEDAIQEVRQGKRPGKQVFFSNHDDRLDYRSNDDEIPYVKDRYAYEIEDEPTPRYIRKAVYPAPTVRPRRVIYEQPVEEPIVVRRQIVQRDRTPPQKVLIHRSPQPEKVVIHRPPPTEKVIVRRPVPRPTTFYYVDREGQMLPQDHSPPPEPPRRYIVQNRRQPPPPARTVRVIHQRAQTPPPLTNEVWHTGPKRQIKSDTEIIERNQRIRRDDTFYSPILPKIPEMYHIEAVPNHNYRSPINSPVQVLRTSNTPPPKIIHQGDRNIKQRKIEPIEEKTYIKPIEEKAYIKPEPTVVRRVYKKLPPGKYEPPKNAYNSDGNLGRSVRKNDKNRFPPRQYGSSPIITNRNDYDNPDPFKDPSIYYLQSRDTLE